MPPDVTAKTLRAAAALVLQGWCRYKLGRTAAGKSCPPCSNDAAAWCLAGAITRAATDLAPSCAWPLIDDARVALTNTLPDGATIHTFNDTELRNGGDAANWLELAARNLERTNQDA